MTLGDIVRFDLFPGLPGRFHDLVVEWFHEVVQCFFKEKVESDDRFVGLVFVPIHETGMGNSLFGAGSEHEFFAVPDVGACGFAFAALAAGFAPDNTTVALLDAFGTLAVAGAGSEVGGCFIVFLSLSGKLMHMYVVPRHVTPRFQKSVPL